MTPGSSSEPNINHPRQSILFMGSPSGFRALNFIVAISGFSFHLYRFRCSPSLTQPQVQSSPKASMLENPQVGPSKSETCLAWIHALTMSSHKGYACRRVKLRMQGTAWLVIWGRRHLCSGEFALRWGTKVGLAALALDYFFHPISISIPHNLIFISSRTPPSLSLVVSSTSADIR